MIIKSIELKNYRLYKGTNKVVFPYNENKNLFLITGKNGFGKTTFLNSLLWCLYGRLMVDIDDSGQKELTNGGYTNILNNNLNNICKQKLQAEINNDALKTIKKHGYTADFEFVKEFSNYSISIEFSDVLIPSIPCQSLVITRSYDLIFKKENIEILIDGSTNELTTEIGPDVFINDFILNKDIARFFFFDSEKIETLIETNTIEAKRNLATAYNEVLGVKKYEDLKKNLENLRIRFRRKSTDINSRNRLKEMLGNQSLIYASILKNDQSTIELNNNLQLLRKEDEHLQIQLLREGNGTTLEELNRLEALVETTRQKDVDYKQQLKQYLEFAPFAITGKLLQDTKGQIELDYNLLQSHKDISNQNQLLDNIRNQMQTTFDNLPISQSTKRLLVDSFNSVISKYHKQRQNTKPILNTNKEEYEEFIAVYSNLTTTYRIEFERLADDYRKNKQVLERTARKIAAMHNKENDSLIKSIRLRKNKIEKNIEVLEQQIRQLHEERGVMNNELAVINRKISELSKKVSLDDSDSKKDKVAGDLINELNTFLFSLKNNKKYALERRIKSTMNNLMHKTDFIGSVDISVDYDMIEINLYSSEGTIIKKEELSRGEQQLFATSLLKSLVEESNIKFPIFIDSPLQKLDKSHASKIITEFYPSVSNQVILFPLLHSELTETGLELMKPYVNSAYLLKNDKSNSSLQEIDINNILMY